MLNARNFSLLLIFSFLLTNAATAQVSQGVFKLRPLAPILSKTAVMGYEHTIGDHTSFQLEARYSWGTRTIFNEEVVTRGNLEITPEFRFYLANRKPAPKGFFIGPYATYSRKFQFDANVDPVNAVAGGAQIGYQAWLGRRVSLDFFIGGGIQSDLVPGANPRANYRSGFAFGFGH